METWKVWYGMMLYSLHHYSYNSIVEAGVKVMIDVLVLSNSLCGRKLEKWHLKMMIFFFSNTIYTYLVILLF